MRTMPNPTGKHRRKRRHHGEGTVVHRTDRWRAKPWAAVVPYVDASGRRKAMWLSASSRDEAEALRKREVAKIRQRVLPTDHTVGSYVVDWLATVDVSPSAYDRYRQHVRERILPTLGELPLDALTPPKVRLAMTRWSGAPATRVGTLIVLRMAMRQAMTDRMLADDPVAGIKAPRIRPTTPTVLDIEEARLLRATVAGDRYAPMLAVAIGLGIRRGEMLGLRTPDVDLRAGTVTVSHSLRRVPVSTRGPADEWWRLQPPKADSGRTMPLPRFVAEAITERIAVRDAERRAAKVWAPNDLIFSDPHGNPVAFSTLDNWFKRSLAKAGLPDMRWHELRASTATILLAEGVPELTVMAILGHRSLDMTRRYVKLLPRVSRGAADTMDEVMG